ncbi:MAG: site-2 protease family protein [Pirellulales bacterium]|nr:site-2 protease family protein [Pirellulales bacterium]
METNAPQPSTPPSGERISAGLEKSPSKAAKNEVFLPAVLFLATCISTLWTGAADWAPYAHLDQFDRAFSDFWRNLPQGVGASFRDAVAEMHMNWSQGLTYMAAVLAILLTHELGHFVMAWRYRIPATLPYFIPLPILPFGTMGAVISMEGMETDRRRMFDLGLVGPLAGLLVAIPITWVGVMQLPQNPPAGAGIQFHNPLIIQLMMQYLRPDYGDSSAVYLNQFNAFLMAGWLGMFLTGLNMLPISQLDGGHVAYSLLDRSAQTLARTVLVLAILWVLFSEQYGWLVMLVIIIFLGVDHPATTDDRVPLNPFRRVLGWLALLIPILCLSPIGLTPAAR